MYIWKDYKIIFTYFFKYFCVSFLSIPHSLFYPLIPLSTLISLTIFPFNEDGIV